MTIKNSGIKELKEKYEIDLDLKRFIELQDQLFISIIIPLYNEEKSIKNIINRIPNYFKHEIIIIDDGSKDNSVKEVLKIKNKNLSLIKHNENKGYGAAILTGIKHAKGDIIITIDSDGQHNPEEIPILIQPILTNGVDIVVGSRYKGKSNYRVPLHTRAGEYVVNRSLWYLFHQKVGNNQSGFRAFNKNSLKIFNDVIFSKFGLCTEILFKAAYNGFKICEVPISLNERKHGVSYNKVIEIFKSINSIILLYFLKKIRIGNIIPRLIWQRLYHNLLIYLKRLY
ncbi:MAG: glycosyltransferase family 2 protein [Promethearchaeota archaeon]|nr:MAG: glycosyltransferase family 2 protein [Candidatus Lokiarchaeota archaeon]